MPRRITLRHPPTLCTLDILVDRASSRSTLPVCRRPALAGMLAGYLFDRSGTRWIALSGCCLTALLLMLLRLVDHGAAVEDPALRTVDASGWEFDSLSYAPGYQVFIRC